MTIWRAMHREVAGARRSLRFDLARPTPAPDDTDLIYREFDAYEGPPRRGLAAGGVGMLVLGGAVGTYFAVVGGLGALVDEGAAPPTDPLTTVAGGATPTPPTLAASATPSATQASAPPRRTTVRERATSPHATPSPTCACVTPTPTSPTPSLPSVSPSPTGSPPPTSSPEPTPTDPKPTPSNGE